MKLFECSENGVDRLGLFRIGKYPVFRRNVLRPVVILLEALRDCRHIPTGSKYAALVDTHIPSVSRRISIPALCSSGTLSFKNSGRYKSGQIGEKPAS